MINTYNNPNLWEGMEVRAYPDEFARSIYGVLTYIDAHGGEVLTDMGIFRVKRTDIAPVTADAIRFHGHDYSPDLEPFTDVLTWCGSAPIFTYLKYYGSILFRTPNGTYKASAYNLDDASLI